MLKSVHNFSGFTTLGTDGEVGTVNEIYFDDAKWIVRYLVVETGGWFNSRKVLISPFAVVDMNWATGEMRFNLTKDKLKNGPDIDTDKPVSRQKESEFYDYYGYPYYWTGPLAWGYTAYPTGIADAPPEYAQTATSQRGKEENEQRDPHLRSSKEVICYDIRATDDSVGHVEDFLFDDKDWSIQLMVVDTRNWWPGKKVLISPERIENVSWEFEQIAVGITRDEVENSPEYAPEDFVVGKSSGVYRAGKRPFFEVA